MTSEPDYTGKKMAKETLESSDSSEGEGGYDDASYGSDVQPPGLSKGFVMVHENCCRAIYRPSRMAKDSTDYICLNKTQCRSLAGGTHQVLREKQRAAPGVYAGRYGKNGKLVAALVGTLTDPATLDTIADERRRADRSQALSLSGLTSGLDRSTEETVTLGGLSDAKLTLSDAESLVASEIDQEGGRVSHGSTNSSKEDILLKLMSSLVDKIEKLDSGLSQRDREHTTILRTLMTPTIDTTTASILRPATYTDPVSGVAQRHAAAESVAIKAKGTEAIAKRRTDRTRATATRKKTKATRRAVTHDDDDGVSYDSEGDGGSQGECPSSSSDEDTKRRSRVSRVASSRARLYAIARGKGGSRLLVFTVNLGTASSSLSEDIRRVGSEK